MKLVTIVGARPQFVKAAPLSQAYTKAGLIEFILHTGQHYDFKMSEIFFQEMQIPEPKFNLEVGSGSHALQTAKMLEGIEKILLQEKPQMVILIGDTNSTLAGALVCAKLRIPQAHVEAGLRSYNRNMPEEINRVLTDHCADLLFCPSETAKRNLAKEGIEKGVHVTGDVTIDALLAFLPKAQSRNTLAQFSLKPKEYILLTIHRPDNADHPQHLATILKAFAQSKMPVLFPTHPRVRQEATRILETFASANIHLIEPVGYLDMLCLENNAKLIATDSGGIQKEALYLKVPCITLRTESEWRETLESGWNSLVKIEEKAILEAIRTLPPSKLPPTPYGKGNASEQIAQIIVDFL